MVENIQVRDGDMVSMAKIINENTKNLDSRIKNLANDCNRVFGLIEQDMTTLEKRLRTSNKRISNLAFCVLGLDIIILANIFRIKSLEKKIRNLEDEKVINEFMKDGKADEDDFLK